MGFGFFRKTNYFFKTRANSAATSYVMKEREEQRLFDLDGNARERLVLWIRRRMDEYGITLEALAESIEADAAKTRAVMYRDAYGNTWDGQGDKPDWLARAIYAGQNIDHFRC
jgi:DNA-binding protein H-NS